jgi:hypothetical protein
MLAMTMLGLGRRLKKSIYSSSAVRKLSGLSWQLVLAPAIFID